MSALMKPQVENDKKGVLFLMNVRKDPLNFFVNMMEEEGDYVWYEILGEKVLLLNDATGIESVLKNNFDNFSKGKFYKVLQPLLGNGIFLSEKGQWKQQRSESLPVFSGKNFEEMTQQIVEACQSWVNRINDRQIREETIELGSDAMWFTLDVVLRALCHESRDNVAYDMNQSMKVILEEAEQRIWGASLLPQSLKLKLPRYRKALDFINGLVGDLVSERKGNGKNPNDLLSTLIKNYSDTPEDQRTLQDQIINFLLAGHETTANALSWFFYEISQRPEIKNRILAEIETVIGDKDINYSNIMQMSYTKAAFQETMRLYPPVWTMSRTALQDTIVPLDDGGKIYIPRNSTIMLCSYAVHRREKYWDNPCSFDPERFLRSDERPFFSYFPFSLGPRLCIGHKFAMIESLVAIVMIMKNFDLNLVPGQSIKPNPIITLRPNKPMYFRAKPAGRREYIAQ